MELFLAAIVLVVAVAVRHALDSKTSNKNSKKKDLSHYRYQRKGYLMSAAEHKMFNLLLSAVGGQYYVFPQVHLSTFLDHKIKGQNWKGAFSHINGKSVDFVICDLQRIAPVAAIELDDSTHQRPDRSERDATVERIFRNANMPLVRFENLNSLTPENIRQRLSEVLRVQ